MEKGGKEMKKIGLWALLFLCLTAAAQAEIQINEIMACNGVYEDGEAWEWIEIKNTGNEKISLSGMELIYTRKGKSQIYPFPRNADLGPGEYAVIFCIGYDAPPENKSGLFAPLDISRKGGTIALQKGAETLDTVTYGPQWGNISWGRAGDEKEFCFFNAVTRGSANGAEGFSQRTGSPVFSLRGGLYPEAVTITLSAESNAVIRYTLDGSEPTDASSLYTAPLFFPEGVICLRARAFQEGRLPSETLTQTYFAGISPSVPIVSLVTDEKYLFHSKTGLLVPGNGKIANYYQDWEYPISVEYYDTQGRQGISQGATFRVTGATSRKYGQKTISLFARAAYGENIFSFDPFGNGDAKYKSITLRAAGTESFLTRFRDALLASRAAGLNILYQEAVPVIVYINGEYWGHYNLRERVNKHMIAKFEGVTDEKSIDTMDILKGRTETQQGSRKDWDELIAFCKTKDLKEGENLAWLAQRLDIDNYFTHAIIQMIIGNADIGNVRYYRIPGGKWKCALYDLDAGMMNLKKGPIFYYNKTPQENSNLFFHEPFAALIRVPEMKEKFFTLFGQIILHYLPDDLESEVDQWAQMLEPLMAGQIERWPKCSPKSMSIWKYEVRQLKKICRQRPEEVVKMVCETYQISKADRLRYFADFYAAIGK